MLRRIPWWLYVVLVIGVIVVIPKSKTIDFQEEVRLGDGSKIEIRRIEHLRRTCEAFSCGWALSSSEIRIEGERGSVWRKRLSPLLLDKFQGKYILIATIPYCDEPEYGIPDPAYIQFEQTDSGWQKVKLQPNVFGRKANLLIAPNWYAGESRKVDLQSKESRNEIAAVRNYKKKLAPVTPNNC